MLNLLSLKALANKFLNFIRPFLNIVTRCEITFQKKVVNRLTLFIMITGATKLCNTEKLFAELGWESL